MTRFNKTLDKLSRNKVNKKRFEGATGTDYESSVEKTDLKTQYDDETDEVKKKKIKQRAHLMGVSLE